MTLRARAAVAFVALGCSIAAGGCSTQSHHAKPPPSLPIAVVPATLAVGAANIVVKANTTKNTMDAFKSVGKTSLVAQAGVWELRKADRLAGTLELVTLDNRRADTAVDKDRIAIRNQILSGDPAQLDIDGLPMWSTKDGDRVLYLWYGRQVLCVLQVRSDLLDADETATQMVTHMTQADAWPGLPPEAFEEKP